MGHMTSLLETLYGFRLKSASLSPFITLRIQLAMALYSMDETKIP
jgi:hypothetical protein